MRIHSVGELENLYATTNMTEKELADIINYGNNYEDIYIHLEGEYSADKAALAVKRWKKRLYYEIY